MVARWQGRKLRGSEVANEIINAALDGASAKVCILIYIRRIIGNRA